MMKKFLTAALAVTALLGSGCIFSRNDYVENTVFDLDLPKQVRSDARVRVGVFTNLSGSERRFVVRRSDGRVVSLEYQRWRFTPDLLLTRCMYDAFRVSGGDTDPVPQINGVIYRFEFDERENAARLSVDFTLKFPDGKNNAGSAKAQAKNVTVRADVSVPVKGAEDIAAARAAAMSECVRLAVEKLAAEMRK